MEKDILIQKISRYASISTLLSLLRRNGIYSTISISVIVQDPLNLTLNEFIF